MPREIVPTAGPFAVKVGWAQDRGDVQLGVATDNERSLVWVLYEAKLEELGRAAAQITAGFRSRIEDAKTSDAEAGVMAELGAAILNALDCLPFLEQGSSYSWTVGTEGAVVLNQPPTATSASFSPIPEQPANGVGGLKTGVWADLTRSELNRLIRLLRKARDSAFGKDE